MRWARHRIAAWTTAGVVSLLACGGRLASDDDNESRILDAGNDATAHADGSTSTSDASLADADATACDPIPSSMRPDASTDGGLFFPGVAVWPLGGAVRSMAVGDITGDGRDDLVVAVGPTSAGVATLFIFLQDACGGLEKPIVQVASDTVIEVFEVAIGDVTGDGRNDLVAMTDDAVGVFPQGTDGKLGAGRFTSDNLGPFGFSIGDFNGDGLNDVVKYDGFEVDVLLQTPSHDLAQPIAYIIDDQLDSFAVQIDDFTGDGLLDFVTIGGTKLGIAKQLAGGGFADAGVYPVDDPTVPAGDVYPTTASGDFTGDGRADIAIDFGFGGNLSIFPQTAAGTIGAQVTYANIDDGGPIGAADVDGDGRTDMVELGPDLTVYPQTAGGTIGAPRSSPIPSQNGMIRFGDFNGDGKVDVVTATAFQAGIGSSLVVSYSAR